MVRSPPRRPPRLKPRPYEDGRRPAEGNYNPNSKDRRGDEAYQAKGSFNYRESRGRGRPPVVRLPLMREPREPRFNHWRSPNPDSFQRHSPKIEPGHSQRRPNRSPEVQHQSSSYGPAQGYHRNRGPPFQDHRSPSPRNVHHHGERRPGPAPHYQGSYRDPKRQAGFIPQDQRGREPRWNHGSRGRPYNRMKRWNEDRTFPHPHNGEHRPSGPQRNPREMQGRGSNPERWSPEQESRRQRGPMERQGSRSHSRERERPHNDPHPPPPYRAPSWKLGPLSLPLSASYHRSSPERQMARPRKRRVSEVDMSPLNTEVEHSGFKHPRRERPQLLSVPRPFGGRPLSFRDKSLLIKNRQMRAESLMNLRLPTSVRAQQPAGETRGNLSSVLALRKKRFQPNAAPLREFDPQGEKVKRLTLREETADSSPRDSDTAKEQVESRRPLNSHRSSSIEKRDLVVLSHWPPGPSSSSKECSPRKDGSPKSRTDRNPDRAPMTSKPRSPHEDGKRTHLDRRTFRPFKGDHDNHRPGVFFRRPGPPPMQRSKFFGGPRNSAPEPLMRPAFRKSSSIVTKYRNMRVMRQRPPFTRGPVDQRW
ncbi:serine/arginine repetitive matrix protein 1 isoform X2 [Gouania willdenowi]|uniref:serine/arginine repetitive matrix protein 1 isoform X2 n=1 Tax=Gouania willdenowi TaxID=441366 RepID=UPI00105681E7|nr:serine/arginine repetitive matrix protein 1-like isoform X2 [Gouania willdenowi]